MSQSTALVPAAAAAPAPAPASAPPSFSNDQIAIIKQTIMSGASDMELRFFLELCKHKRLDPFGGQIVARKSRSYNRDTRQWEHRWIYMTTIDGMRAIAEDSGEYDGCDPAEWCGDDGAWVDVWLKKEPPAAARVIAYRRGRKPAVGIANLEFFCQTFRPEKDAAARPTEIWQKGAAHMLAKCAEALALRKAFPRQLGAIYSRDEMQADGARRDVIDVHEYSAPVPTVQDIVELAAESDTDSAPDAEESPSSPPSVSHTPAPTRGPVSGAEPSPLPPPAGASAPLVPGAPAKGAPARPAGGGGGGSGEPAAQAKALASKILACKTEAEVVALSPDVSKVIALLGESPVAADLHRIYSDHRKTVKKASAAPPRGPEPRKPPAAARRDDEPPPPSDEDR